MKYEHESAFDGTKAYLCYTADKEYRRLQTFGTPEELDAYIGRNIMSPGKRFTVRLVDEKGRVVPNRFPLKPMSHGRALIFRSKMMRPNDHILVEV